MRLPRYSPLPALAVSLLTACGTAAAPEAEPRLQSSTTPASSSAAGTGGSATTDPTREFQRLEDSFDARLGVHAIDTGTGRTVSHRADERFAYASTFKVLVAAQVLDQTTDAELDATIRYSQDDLVDYSPITQTHVGRGMTLRAIADAALRYSDNTAANLLLHRLGGPKRLERYLRADGDDVTEPARNEPGLNEAKPGDPRDTSTPAAMAANLRRYAVDDGLAPEDRTTLNAWMRANTTGAELIRAGVPDGWVVEDKTGSGGYGTRNDIAVLRPPGRAPIVLAVMSSRDHEGATYDNALIARAARTAIADLEGTT